MAWSPVGNGFLRARAETLAQVIALLWSGVRDPKALENVAEG
ncbi:MULTISPECIES: hypothetical protein [unclassified Ensifer]|nr:MULTISPECIES: hypothetical protein [unclassified Ensifer]